MLFEKTKKINDLTYKNQSLKNEIEVLKARIKSRDIYIDQQIASHKSFCDKIARIEITPKTNSIYDKAVQIIDTLVSGEDHHEMNKIHNQWNQSK